MNRPLSDKRFPSGKTLSNGGANRPQAEHRAPVSSVPPGITQLQLSIKKTPTIAFRR